MKYFWCLCGCLVLIIGVVESGMAKSLDEIEVTIGVVMEGVFFIYYLITHFHCIEQFKLPFKFIFVCIVI
jgi:hypothetical protein